MEKSLSIQKAIAILKKNEIVLFTETKGIRSAIGQTSSSQRYRTKGVRWTKGVRVRKSYVTRGVAIDLVNSSSSGDFFVTSEREELLTKVQTLFAEFDETSYSISVDSFIKWGAK